MPGAGRDHGEPLEVLWNPRQPKGSLRNPREHKHTPNLHGSKSKPLAPPGSSWLLLAPLGSSWLPLAPPGSSWVHLGLPESPWLPPRQPRPMHNTRPLKEIQGLDSLSRESKGLV